MEAGPDVVFDYDGALTVAKRLWAFADALGTLMTDRETASGEALVGWLGPHGESFADRVDTERIDIDATSSSLRDGANQWAAAWKDAIDQQNRVLHARAWEHSKNNQGFLGIGKLDGIERPPDPEPRALPQPPEFAATGGFEEY